MGLLQARISCPNDKRETEGKGLKLKKDQEFSQRIPTFSLNRGPFGPFSKYEIVFEIVFYTIPSP
jgi:hypothetical protein